MKKISSLFITFFLTGLLIAQPPKGPADAGMTFGEKITSEGSISSGALVEKLATEKTIEAKVEGEVSQVCTAEGCWLKMKANDKTIMVKMKDHKFLVPLSMNGKTIVVKGVAEQKVTSIEMLKHYAEDAGKTQADIDAIKEPKQEIIIQAIGIVVIK